MKHSYAATHFFVHLSNARIVFNGYDSVDQAITSYLDGCRDTQSCGLNESLERVNDDPAILA